MPGGTPIQQPADVSWDVTRAVDTVFLDGASLASGNELNNPVSALGATTLAGTVTRATTSYDLKIDWLDSAGGTVLFTDDIATGVGAGTETDFSESPVRSPYADVRIVDAGSGSGAVTATIYLQP